MHDKQRMNGGAEHGALSGQAFVPVCAIGASAGGVTALQALFRQIPTDLGLAYVVILHLSPDHPSALSEILSTCTRMRVLQVEDGPTLKPNCVYVIPPDRELVIEGDTVAARAFSEPRGRRSPIDVFFRSVAAARGDGIAVVLSGAGADGALGVRAVKEAGGVILVQEPADAAFASMPMSAVATGVADFVVPLARLAELMAEVAHSKEAVRSLDIDGSVNDLRRIMAFLRARTGHDFSSYKRATCMRRVVRRMQVCRTNTLSAYADYLLTNPEETKALLSDLLISVTMFFRDPLAYEALESHVVRALFNDLQPGSQQGLRAWVVGCATGGEAYSLAMLLHEEAARRKLHPQVQIFATDLDEGALATAREGRYPRTIETDVSQERLSRFFVDEGTHYRVRKELRECVLFASHSVIKDPPFTRLDLITCRNLLIYLERWLQQQISAIFHYGLKPGRFLFLGSAETADNEAELFAPLDREARIYVTRPHIAQTLPLLPHFTAAGRVAVPELSFSTQQSNLPVALHASALEETAPASALVDDGQKIVHLSPSAGRFILHSAGPISNLLPDVVRPELRLDLRLALQRALHGKTPTLTHPAIVAFDEDKRRIGLHVIPVGNDAHTGTRALIFFLDGGIVPDGEDAKVPPDTRPDEVLHLHAELREAQEALLFSQTGHETAIQELRASNEELQSINEEYRSTAEELESSKEELQSINEELHTVNAELKSKLTSISIAHSDLQNLTAATEIGTLFLDPELRIKMFTPAIADLFSVTKSDIGRLITDFTHNLEYTGLEADARRVLTHLVPVETEIESRSGQRYATRLRPYRTVEDHIDGTVVTFVDITARWKAEAALSRSEQQLRALLRASSQVLYRMSPTWNQMRMLVGGGFLADTDQPSENWLSQYVPEEDRAQVQAGIQKAIHTKTTFDLEHQVFRLDGQVGWTHSRAIPLFDDEGNIVEWFGSASDITQRKIAEAALRDSEDRFRQFGEASQDVLWIRDAKTLQWEYLTPAFEVIYGLDRSTALAGDSIASWVELILPEDRERAVDHLQRVREGKEVTFEYRVRRAGDDHVQWLRNTDFPIRNEAGQITRIGGVSHDITELKEAEEALAAAEQRQRVLVEGIPQLVWRATDVGGWTWASPQWTYYTGQAAADSRGWGWLERVHPDDREGAERAWLTASGAGGYEADFRIWQVASATHHWFQSRATPVRNASGNIIEWLGTSTDINELRGFQDRQSVLVSELQHRTRNLIGVVRSIADMTLASSKALDEFAAKFSDRLAALARVQSLLSRLNEGDRVTFDELIGVELSALGHPAGSDRVTLEGPTGIALRSSTVQILAMALHELATNACKYGALTQPSGQLSVIWHLDRSDTDDQLWLHVKWLESGLSTPPDGSDTQRGGAGRTLIERALPYQLGARTIYEITPAGVYCSISLPVSKRTVAGGRDESR